MPFRSVDIELAANYVGEIITMEVEDHFVFNLSLLDVFGQGQPNEFYGDIGVMAGGTNLENINASLASGYFGRGSPLSWTGKMLTTPGQYLYAFLSGTQNSKIRLAATLFKVVAMEGNTIIVDP